MRTFETSATVEEQDQVGVAGLPFQPGIRVRRALSNSFGAHNCCLVIGALS